MAKIKAPLFSLSAWGTIKNALTFSRRQSGQQARFQRAGTDHARGAREQIRAAFQLGLILWKSLPLEEKSYWTQIESKGYANV